MDTPIIDANIEFLSVGFTAMYKDAIFDVGIGAGFVGYSLSVDVGEILEMIFCNWFIYL